ncbi:hypothetical protein OMP43_21115 [Sphingomonas sp. CBMAI 2297]|uniref:hypothetical protein n=1 Tax=Sphingomonas sp. CBMAI 2297 TaxID=2991720 RepID=UPI002455C3C9|nr:hypothetical protein [Sphingomonas sp. CBMAI 2297]MDH4746532.1 hypothetical protein [Sphingomonas sp. CBMAI 2297]
MEHQPIQPEAADALAPYTPIALRARHDGWTADRQRGFLIALAETGCISEACAAVGLTARSAYRLRRRPDATGFAEAWNDALLVASARLTTLAFERAARGTIREYWKNGELVAECRQPSDQLLKFLLQHLRGDWFGRDAIVQPAEGARRRFDAALDGLADNAELADPLMLRDYRAEPPHDLIAPPGEDEEW